MEDPSSVIENLLELFRDTKYLPEEYLQVFYEYYRDGRPQPEIGKTHFISTARVSQLVGRVSCALTHPCCNLVDKLTKETV